ncbi:MAG: hypothetical protein ABI425_02115 [Patescibacteria group bacterium]
MKKAIFTGLAALLLAGCTPTSTTNNVVPEPTSAQVEEMAKPTDAAMMEKEDTMMEPMTVTLGEQNKSGQKGLATLEERDGKVVVTIMQTGTASTVAQPAHIHMGSCPTPGAVKFPLTDVVNGKSVTTVDTTIADLKKMMPIAINVHKSAAESKMYTSCGDIK